MEDSVSVSVNNKKRTRDENDTESDVVELSEVKRLKENLLDGLEDEEVEFCSTSHDLDSLLKSFEEEITNSPSAAEVVDLTADLPDLGYLLEASDDELGLPPTESSDLKNELERVDSDFGGEFWEVPSHDSFEFGIGESDNYAPLDGLFDYSDVGFGSGDLLWRSESMPAQ